MKTNDLFKQGRSAKKLNEGISKTFGKQLDLESFDLPKLEDARNKLRTQLHVARSSAGFNETLENDTYHEAQWMLDAINAEIAERQEFIADPHTADVSYEEDMEEGFNTEVDDFFHKVANSGDDGFDMLYNAQTGKYGREVADAVNDMAMDIARGYRLHPDDDFEDILGHMMDQIEADYTDSDADKEPEPDFDQEYNDESIGEAVDIDQQAVLKLLKRFEETMNDMGGYGDINVDKVMSWLSAGNAESAADEAAETFTDQDGGELYGIENHILDLQTEFEHLIGSQAESAPPGDKYERMVKHIKKGYAKDGKLTPKEKSIAYATAWKAKKNEDTNESHATYMGKVKNKKTGIELDVHAAEPADEQGRRTNTMIYLKDPKTEKVLHKFLSSKDLETNYDWIKYPSKYEDFSIDESKVDNFSINDIKELEAMTDLDLIKTKAKELISTPSKRPIKSEKIKWFNTAIDSKKDKISVIKLMYDLLLSGEGTGVIGSKSSMAPNTYRKKFGESTTHGENMKKIYEGEIQQAQSIVTAKTMVDRVGRWIEELSGMENDTLLQLGDQIRDEMSADQAKSFISTVAPAIQQALAELKSTRETLATGVRQLTGEEQGAEMLGAEPTAGEETVGAEPEMAPDMGGEAEPDMMNPPEEGGASPDDAFAAAEPGAGGPEAAGRARRESVEFGNSLLKVLAG